MKYILVIADYSETGGTGTYLRLLLDYLSTEPFSISLLIKKTDLSTRLETLCKTLKIKIIKYSNPFFKIENQAKRFLRKMKIDHFYSFLSEYILLRKHLANSKYDLFIVSQGGADNYFSLPYYNIPTIYVLHSLYQKQNKLYMNLYGRLLKPISKSHVRITTVSKCAMDILRTNFPISITRNTSYIHNPSIINTSNQPFQNWDKNVILTIGHLVKYKNPFIWYKTAQLIHKEFPNIKFVWLGEGDLQDSISKLARKDKFISFPGYSTDVIEYYSKTKIYFHPSLTESHGIAIVDALSLGIPCVASNIGGVNESIENNYKGFLCTPANPNEFAGNIIFLLRNDSTHIKMPKNAYQKYIDNITPDIWMSRF